VRNQFVLITWGYQDNGVVNAALCCSHTIYNINVCERTIKMFKRSQTQKYVCGMLSYLRSIEADIRAQ